MPTGLHQLLRNAKDGHEPRLIARLPSGFVFAGDVQVLPGTCMLVADPMIASLNDLDEKARVQYSLDMIRIGDALLAATDSIRINYETWCNLTPYLHTHIVPRYEWEQEPKRGLPSRQAYDWNAARPFDPKGSEHEIFVRLQEFLKQS
jgi:diadenosine tetraphosphate (Ap4A) HIT family hydrolase